MQTLRCSTFARFLLALALATLTGCTTIQYRDVQSQFEQAVRADNEQSNQPFTDTAQRYEGVAAELTPAYIAKLDEKLQPNAWTLRAVSEWRAGQFNNALQSSNDGLNAIARLTQKDPKFDASRDSVILTMIPGLVEDARLRQRLKELGPQDIAAHYNDYREKFRNALRALAEANGKMTDATPPAVRYYWYYQSWRVLTNWRIVISKLPSSDQRTQANKEADAIVSATLGAKSLQGASTLKAAADEAEKSIPEGHGYRQLIRLEQQR
jgi:hypothetical protein